MNNAAMNRSPRAERLDTMLLQTSLAEITIAVQNRNSMILDANATVVARERSQTLGEDDEVMADVQLGDVIEAGAGA